MTIELKKLTKRFGALTAVDSVDLTVGDGEVLCLLENYTQALAYTACPAATTTYQCT